MKIAVTGKGGSGKTTVCALLCREFSRLGYSVLGVDADPDSNLAAALGFPDGGAIRPIVEYRELIKERAGGGGGLVRLNPRVDDIPDTHSATHGGIKLIVMGGIKKGGGGCACPENIFVKELLGHILLKGEEIVIIDMEAGIEHLGRGTAQGVDLLIVVTEPSLLSVESARRIRRLAEEIGIRRIAAIANKTGSEGEADIIKKELVTLEFLGELPFSPALRGISLKMSSVDGDPVLRRVIQQIAGAIIKTRVRRD